MEQNALTHFPLCKRWQERKRQQEDTGGEVTVEENGTWEPQKERKSLQSGTWWHIPARAIRTNVDGEHGLVEAVADHSPREGVSAAA